MEVPAEVLERIEAEAEKITISPEKEKVPEKGTEKAPIAELLPEM